LGLLGGKFREKGNMMRKIALVYVVISLIGILAGCSLMDDNKSGNTQSEKDTILMKNVVFMNVLQGDTYTSGIKEYNDIRTELMLSNEYDYEYDELENADTLYAFTVSLIGYGKKNDDTKPTDYPVRGQDETSDEYDNRCIAYKRNKLQEIMKSEGILIVRDYSGNDIGQLDCVIACTMNDLVRVFNDEDGEINKWHYYVNYTVRPDMEQILRDAGWSEKITFSSYDWYKHNKEKVQEKIGVEIQCVMSVEVE
jgi:hypothetical protein